MTARENSWPVTTNGTIGHVTGRVASSVTEISDCVNWKKTKPTDEKTHWPFVAGGIDKRKEAAGLNGRPDLPKLILSSHYADCLFLKIRTALDPNGSSIKAPENIVVGSGTAAVE